MRPVASFSETASDQIGLGMVRSRGLERPHPHGYMHARLPIPPRPQKQNSLLAQSSVLRFVPAAAGVPTADCLKGGFTTNAC
jgi:hypothetical protein